ncbi:DUF7310 family coiled-coil domain-containing protein [Halostagnicola kamekurae]|uniref:DUF7310 domain-containing protein n=1 Tax=Halostagnicola kamekurae TaxID=619731 RepID=A0A1I6S1G6_9EURY|nr:hypothetical protein [Halostagnicola kamekurae]SFS70578.1 hypothetical protein SAMN04488556_2357 [Halostagnicola kamekurae]
MSDFERVERRLTAVERTLADAERPVSDLPERAALADEVERLNDRIDDLSARVAGLEGSTQALCGYVGNVRSVNEAVERRADAAVATVDRLEGRVDALEDTRTDAGATLVVSRALLRDSQAGRYQSKPERGTGRDTDSDSAIEQRVTSEPIPPAFDPVIDDDQRFVASSDDQTRADANPGRRSLDDSSTTGHRRIEAQLAELTGTGDEPGRRASAKRTAGATEQPSTGSDGPARTSSRADDDTDTSRDRTLFEAVRGLFS